MNSLRLAPLLTVARLRRRRGDAWLDLLAVASFALGALLALTVAGGIWMFYTWESNPSSEMISHVRNALGDYVADGSEIFILGGYLDLALLAGALLVLPIFSLGASAARLGAHGRAARLASLRLVGASGGEVVSISVLETAIQWIVGALIGTATYFLSLPAWANVQFVGRHIDPTQMVLPPSILFVVLGMALVISLISTIAGLRRVRISPLGVAHNEAGPIMRHWRPLVFATTIVVIVLWFSYGGGVDITLRSRVMVTAFLVMFVMGTISLVGPWVLQLVALALTRTRFPSLLIAVRRILDNPRTAWNTVSAITLLSFITGAVALIPSVTSISAGEMITRDVSTGLLITLGFGFTVAALSALMNQASLVFDRAAQTAALSQVGFPISFFGRTRFIQSIGPLVLTVAFSLGTGFFLSFSIMKGGGMEAELMDSSVIRTGIVVGAGILTCMGAIALCEPLERHVLANMRRMND